MEKCEFEYLGPYHMEGVLGRGGMGTVYKGRHAKTGEPVAVKVIAQSVADNIRFRRRFMAEVETLKRLVNPHIVRMIGYGEEHGLLFYSMEYVDGQSMHEHLLKHRRMPWNEVIRVGIEITAALKHAHDQGIIHRDLKPANLMLTKEGTVKLTDFGVARFFGATEMTVAGSVIGTADFMPPEQAEGKPVTVRSDIYSLGSVLFALLSGRAPFAGKSMPEVMYAVRYTPAPEVATYAPDTPIELQELIGEMLQKDPLKRPPTALVVGNRLKAIQQGIAKLEAERGQTEKAEARGLSDKSIAKELTSIDLNDEDDAELLATGLNGSTHDRPTAIASDSMMAHLNQPTVQPTAQLTQPPGASSSLSLELPRDPHSTQLERPGMESPLPARASHYTAVTEDETRAYTLGINPPAPAPGVDWVHYGSIAGIIVLLCGAIGWGAYMMQPQSADTLYSEIRAVMESGDENRLLESLESFEEFASRFPSDERTAEVQDWIEEAELAKMSRTIERRATKEGVDQLSACEQGFLSCMRALRRDPQEARAKISAFLAIYSAATAELSPMDKRYVSLAQRAAENLKRNQRTTVSPAMAELERTVRAAEKSMPKDRLPAFYKSIIELYGDKPWAKDLVSRARSLSEQLPSQ